MLYGSEIWGHEHAPQIEQVQFSFCKFLLGVRRNTNDVAVLGECGRMPLSVLYLTRCIKYWLKILNMETERYPYRCYLMLKRLAEQRTINTINWAFKIRELLFRFGFGHAWFNQGVGNTGIFLTQFTQRVKDCSLQLWNADVLSSPKLKTYCTFKSTLEQELYLSSVFLTKYKTAMSRFRCSAHNLEIERGRHEGIPVNERLCKYCIERSMFYIEDEYHFICICSQYSNFREELLPIIIWVHPTREKFVSLMKSKNIRILNQLAAYIYHAMECRNRDGN